MKEKSPNQKFKLNTNFPRNKKHYKSNYKSLIVLQTESDPIQSQAKSHLYYKSQVLLTVKIKRKYKKYSRCSPKKPAKPQNQ